MSFPRVVLALALAPVSYALQSPYDAPTVASVHTRGLAMLEPVDFDGDGDLDLAVGSSVDRRIFVLPNEGNGEFGAPIDIYTRDILVPNAYFVGFFADDLDGDGDADFVVDAAYEILVVWNNGVEGFESETIESNHLPPIDHVIRVADINGDGRLDILASEGWGTAIDIVSYENLGSGAFAPRRTIVQGVDEFATGNSATPTATGRSTSWPPLRTGRSDGG